MICGSLFLLSQRDERGHCCFSHFVSLDIYSFTSRFSSILCITYTLCKKHLWTLTYVSHALNCVLRIPALCILALRHKLCYSTTLSLIKVP